MRNGAFMAVVVACAVFHATARAQGAPRAGLQSFSGALPTLSEAPSRFDWNFDLSREKFYVVPPKGVPGKPCGVVVFVSPADVCEELPQGWESVLRERRLIFIAPQSAGNKQEVSRRAGLAVLAACKLAEVTKVDTNRIYVSGFSGGARMATFVSFLRPSPFVGVLAICGADYCQRVPRVKATQSDEYGYFSVEDAQAQEAKRRVRYVLVTGAKDFRYGNILDLYSGGFLKDGYRVRLIDVPGMGHAVCPAKALREGLSFLEEPAEAAAGRRRF